jgi:hypothetical protein
MLPTKINRSVVVASLGLSLFWSMGALAAQPESEAKVVARLYKDYGWEAFASQYELFGDGLTGESKTTLEKYFSPDLAKLLIDDTACEIREKGICNLDFEPLFDSQDPRITNLEVTRLSPGKVRVEFKDPTTDDVTRIEFKLVTVGGRWRIADIIYHGHPQESLKKVLSQPIPKG